ncbi:MAG: helix-hairpin-helix domain-containing protein [Solirubrobacteraceae bacterium]
MRIPKMITAGDLTRPAVSETGAPSRPGRAHSRPGRGHRRRVGTAMRRLVWAWLLVGGVGFLAWVPFLWAGLRARRRSWIVWAAVYLVAAVLASAIQLFLSQAIGVAILLGLLVTSSIHALALDPAYEQAILIPVAFQRAAAHAHEVAFARALAVRDPRKAREVGVGRPDLEWAFDAGLIDINNAPASVISNVSTLDQDTVQLLLQTREQVGGFDSLADLDLILNLPAESLRQLADLAVFLPAR